MEEIFQWPRLGFWNDVYIQTVQILLYFYGIPVGTLDFSNAGFVCISFVILINDGYYAVLLPNRIYISLVWIFLIIQIVCS